VSGRILIGNIDLATIDENAIRKYVGLLSRCPVIFKGSLLSNIDPEGVLPEKEVGNDNYLSVMCQSNILSTLRKA
jgi:ABC-type multidrug transport system fused ATPase/permease subunit